MNWDNARYFLAVARIGSLRSAAASLGVDQATVGRRIAAFEAELGATLFRRTPQGYELTSAAETVLNDAEAMEAAASAIGRKAAGVDAALTGPIRIATTDTLADGFVLPALKHLRDRHPQIEIVLSTSVQITDLARGEADLAIRGSKPTSGDLIIRKLTTVEMGLYASVRYVAARGLPVVGSAFAGHDLVMFSRASIPRHWQDLCGEPIIHGRVAVEVTSQLLLLSAIEKGFGIGILSSFIADARTSLVRVLPERRDPVDIWLAVHPDVYGAARIRAAIQAITDQFAGKAVAA
ncbi:MAG: LysR family transcriptional regulator [Rhodopila sp.]|nr:LysR family transcriptional regulator [Rhodopila sp.]